MQIATWNVNSIKAHLEAALAWFDEAKPDVVCLQELKCETQAFPAGPFEERGYTCAVSGQKTYNGVAILSRFPLEDVTHGLPGDDGDDHARYIEAVVSAPSGIVRVASIYLPNGNPAPGPKFDYKLAWMDRLIAHAGRLLALEEAFVLAGDYNVIPAAIDARFPDNWRKDALFLPESRAKFRELQALGLIEAVRALAPGTEGIYSFWDYQAGAWQKNNGIRIDHHLLSPQAADRLESWRIDRHVRGWEKPSDHVPVLITIGK